MNALLLKVVGESGDLSWGDDDDDGKGDGQECRSL